MHYGRTLHGIEFIEDNMSQKITLIIFAGNRSEDIPCRGQGLLTTPTIDCTLPSYEKNDSVDFIKK